jgi:hypothetical protein
MATTMVVLGTETNGTITGGRVDDGWAADVAAAIYDLLPYDDDRTRDEFIDEIADWLIEGDLVPGQLTSYEELTALWVEHDGDYMAEKAQ